MTPKSIAIVVHILSKSIMANLIIFSSSVLLENYPVSMLSYFLFGFLGLEIATTLIVGPYLSKNIQRTTQSVLLLIVTAIVGFLFIEQYQFYYTLFLFAVFFAVVEVVVSLTSWNSVRSALDILEFKRISPILPIAGNVTEGIVGFVNLGLISWFDIGYLPYVIIVSLIAYWYFIKKLSPITEPLEHHARKVPLPTGFPIAVRLFIYGFTLAIGLAFSEYLFKIVVLEQRHNEIGQFISCFVGIFNILSAVIAIFSTRNLASKSPAILLLTLPLYWIMASMGVLFNTNIYTVATLYGGYYLLYYTFTTVGRELIMNALPIKVRDYWQGWLTIFPIELGYLLAASALIAFGKTLNHTDLLYLIIISCSLSLMACVNIKTLYIKGLQKELLAKNKTWFKEKRQQTAFVETLLSKSDAHPEQTELHPHDIPLATLQEHDKTRALHREILAGTTAFPRKTNSEEQLYKVLTTLSQLYECYPIKHPVLKAEIKSRLVQHTEQLFYWLSLYSKNLSIRFYLPSILYGDAMTRTKAIELICNTIHEKGLKVDILDVFHMKSRKKPSQTALNRILQDDHWLNYVYQHTTEQSPNAHLAAMHMLRDKTAYKYTPGEFLFLLIHHAQFIELKAQQSHTLSSKGCLVVLKGSVYLYGKHHKAQHLGLRNRYQMRLESPMLPSTVTAQDESKLLFIPEQVFISISKMYPTLMNEYGIVFVSTSFALQS